MRHYLDSIHHLAQVRLSLYSSPNRTAPLIYLHREIKYFALCAAALSGYLCGGLLVLARAGWGDPLFPYRNHIT